MKPKHILTLAAFLLIGLLVGCGQSKKSPGEEQFNSATNQITRYQGKASFGNTPQAEELAATFATLVTKMRDASIEKSSKKSISISKGNMLVYCQLTKTRCAFLLHVPELRKFTSEAKELMAEMSWLAAQTALGSKEIPCDNLAVGLRGVMIYDSIYVGQPLSIEKDIDKTIQKRGSSLSLLYPFFVPEQP